MKGVLLLALVIALVTGSVPLFVVAATGLGLAAGHGYWQRRLRASLLVDRAFERRIFFGDSLRVVLRVRNAGALPVHWLIVRDNAPYTLAGAAVRSHAISLHGRETREIGYELRGLQRGYQAIGPVRLSVGNILGLPSQELEVRSRQHVLVYPRLLPSHTLQLPSRMLSGEQRSRRHFHGDPSRVVGVREYMRGDPYRDIHWRATATAGSLQIKIYQPSTSLHTMIFLDQRSSSYPLRRSGSSELAVSIAASLVACLVERGQEVGLVTNGLVRPIPKDSSASSAIRHDALISSTDLWLFPRAGASARPLPLGKGIGHLQRVLETLACLAVHDDVDCLADLLLRHTAGMPWGSTAVAVSGEPSDALFMALHRVRERGIVVVLYLAGRRADAGMIQARGRALGVQVRVISEHHLEETVL